jgi:hypothetical protein
MPQVKAAAVPLVLVPALGAVQGGFQPDAWVWAGALAAWAAAVALVASASPGLLRAHWPWATAAAAVLAWTALSAIWSSRPSQSILEARRAIVYAAVVLGLLLLARRGATRTLVLATYAGTGGLVVYALFRYLLSTRHYTVQAYLLSDPLGYANAVGILAAIAALVALGIAEADTGMLGLVAAATTPPLVLALTLTASDASWLALGAGIAVIALLLPEPRRFLVVLGAVVVPCAVLVLLGKVSQISAAVGTPRFGGATLALAALAGSAAAAAALAAARRIRIGALRDLRRALLAVVLVLALGGAAGVAHAGSTEPRASYYSVAWRDYTAHPLLGSGAGTYGFAWARSGKEVAFGGALDAHSLYLETLAELGPIGLVLVLLLLLVPLRALRVARTPYVAAALGAYVAFLIHAGLDWDWEMPAVVVAGLSCGAAALAALPASAAPIDRRRRLAFVAAALVLAGCAIAGARSHAEPSAQTPRAPCSGALD